MSRPSTMIGFEAKESKSGGQSGGIVTFMQAS